MSKAKIAEKSLSDTTKRIIERALAKGYVDPYKELRQELARRGVKGVDSGNWSNMWWGKKKKGLSGWALNVLIPLALLLETTPEDLLGTRPPIPIVGEPAAFVSFSYREEFWQGEKLGDATNFLSEDEKILKEIYALRVKDNSMVPVMNEGDILYVQKDPDPEAFYDFAKVVYCDEMKQAWVRLITLEKENISLLVPGQAVKPKILPRKHLKNCDLVIFIQSRIQLRKA